MTKLLYLDIETTGLDCTQDQVIEMGAIWDDGTLPIEYLPTFRGVIKRDRYVGEPYALQMHATLFKEIANNDFGDEIYCGADVMVRAFNDWLVDVVKPETDRDYHINVCGKNVGGFDFQFLLNMGGGFRRSGGGMKLNKWLFDPRVVDVGGLYWNPLIDEHIPSLRECLIRAGMQSTVRHTSIDDCYLCVALVRNFYENCKSIADDGEDEEEDDFEDCDGDECDDGDDSDECGEEFAND